MKKILTGFICSAALMVGACSTLTGDTGEQDAHDHEGNNPWTGRAIDLATGNFINTDGTQVGTVRLLGRGDRIELVASVSGLSAGSKGFHLHQAGTCTTPDFTSAQGHLNPLSKSHGKLSEGGKHIGDLPNLVISQSGDAKTHVTLHGSDKQQMLDWIFDADGTAVMIHAGPDDYKSDPTGNAGGRIACAVLNPIR